MLFNLAQPDEAQLFMQELHQPREAEGIDFWWIDGSNAQFPGVNSQLWTNHVYWTHQAQQSQRRPLILSRTGVSVPIAIRCNFPPIPTPIGTF
uniref:Uncharacterized protein n=1 Tax=Desertifilum tharense IPPAS B-1220 TaxID=1781255 RepID=A0ACD5GQS1_9CYAN